jgi:hypothetical protein
MISKIIIPPVQDCWHYTLAGSVESMTITGQVFQSFFEFLSKFGILEFCVGIATMFIGVCSDCLLKGVN